MLFRKKKVSDGSKREVPKGSWEKCKGCGELLARPQLEKNLWVCPHCGFHFRKNSHFYMNLILDGGLFSYEILSNITSLDPLNFPDYPQKLASSKEKAKILDAARAGISSIDGHPVVFFITDFNFMGGSMGSVVGEKFYRACELAVQKRLPLVALTSSGGGARMQEGIISLMQLVKTVEGVVMLDEARLPFIVILTDPTMGGVMASFASLGDILLAEPGALLGFAGPRVIESTIREKLPPDFQRSQFLLEHGLLDAVVPRSELKERISLILDILLGESGYGTS